MNRALHFYLLRLRNASTPEIIYRIREFLLIHRLKSRVINEKNPISVPHITRDEIDALVLPTLKGGGGDGLGPVIIRLEPNTLNADYNVLSQYEDRKREIFCTDLSLNDAMVDIRQVWEPARLQHVSVMLARLQKDTDPSIIERIKKRAKDAVLTWIDKNPFLFGLHYMSPMECGLRVPVFFYCLKTLDNLNDHEFRLLLKSAYQHAWWISRRLALYSSLGNHTISECVGLVFAGMLFKNTKEGKKWFDKGLQLLKQEQYHQILSDGGPAEQSLAYHRFVMDLYWLVVNFLESNEACDCGEMKEQLMKGEFFYDSFQYNDGDTVPSIGDGDDGWAVAPGIAPYKPAVTTPHEMTEKFDNAGYTIIKATGGVKLIFDHGPLGMPPFYNHGHADALSIVLSKGDKELLVDPGTFRYNGVPEWRTYFKSTRAHNTVTIDDQDQAVQETGFIWTHPYKTRLLTARGTPGGYLTSASHDGYTRLSQPVWHTRSVYCAEQRFFFIKDTFSGTGKYVFELNYHCHPAVHVAEKNGWWIVERQGCGIFMALLCDGCFTPVRGRDDPILGWYSPAYGIKQPSVTLQCIKKGEATSVFFVTALCLDAPPDPGFINERIASIEW